MIKTPYEYSPISNGLQEIKINIDGLYSSATDRIIFWDRWNLFLKSIKPYQKIFDFDSKQIKYVSPVYIPNKRYIDKPNLMMLFGNPAPQSIVAGSMFANEKGKKTHRIWSALAKASILKFKNKIEHSSDLITETFARKRALLNNNYESNFNLAFSNFFSMPSSASDIKWSGVAGLKKLFGSTIFNRMCTWEMIRLRENLNLFSDKHKNIFINVFQKDSFNAIKADEVKPYERSMIYINSFYHSNLGNNISILLVPPTRLLHTKKAILALRERGEICLDYLNL